MHSRTELFSSEEKATDAGFRQITCFVHFIAVFADTGAWVKFNNDSTLLCCPFTWKLLEIVNPTNGDWFYSVKLSKLVKLNVIFNWLRAEIREVILALRF